MATRRDSSTKEGRHLDYKSIEKRKQARSELWAEEQRSWSRCQIALGLCPERGMRVDFFVVK